MTSLVFIAVASIGLAAWDGQSGLQAQSRRDSLQGTAIPIIVEFPLRGEWSAPTTPAKRIPSHGTDRLGERYAFDFVQVDWARGGKPFYRGSALHYLLRGVPLEACYGWGKTVHAPCDGEIIQAEDGCPERRQVHWLTDQAAAITNTRTFRQDQAGISTVAGNYIVMRCRAGVYAAFAHLQEGSIAVKPGQKVRKGQVLGKVGHSGNSTAPHLHFQLMDSSDLLTAKGLPCAFERYEVFRDGEWKSVSEGVPSDTDRIRFEW